MTSGPISGQAYIEQLRARRLASRGAATAAPPATEPVQPAPVTPPLAAEQPAAAPPTTAQPVAEPVPQPQAPIEQDPIAAQLEALQGAGLNYQDQPTNQDYDPTSDPNLYVQPGNDQLFPGYDRPLPEETVFEWTAQSRPFKKRSRQYFSTVAIIAILVSMILFFAGQMLPIAVVVSVAFLAYVLAVVPPDMIRLRITTYGVRSDNQIFYWEELGRFWFSEKFGQKLVNIEVNRFPFRIGLLLNDQTEETLREILSEVLLEEKPPATGFDRAAEWLQRKIPLEFDH